MTSALRTTLTHATSLLFAIGIAGQTNGFDMVFVRIDTTANQTTSGICEAGLTDWCTSDPTEEPFDTTGWMLDQDADLATISGGTAVQTSNCDLTGTFLATARNFTARSASTYTPNITSAAQVTALENDYYNCCTLSSLAGESEAEEMDGQSVVHANAAAGGIFETQQAGVLTSEASFTASTTGEAGPDGASVTAPNINLTFEGAPGGFVVDGSTYDEVDDILTEYDMEWWVAPTSANFFARKYVSQYESVAISTSCSARTEPTGSTQYRSVSTMASMFGEY